MLKIVLPEIDQLPEVELQMEHSLVSLSKWEAFYEKPFFSREGMDHEQTVYYIKQMVLGSPPPGDWISRLTEEHYEAITGYINSKQSATWFREDPNAKNNREVITNELIYYWMIGFQIPFDPCETWHVNRLMTLIKICGIKQAKPKKMSKSAQMEEYRRLNEERRKQLGTSG